jgi:hypothetical protein
MYSSSKLAAPLGFLLSVIPVVVANRLDISVKSVSEAALSARSSPSVDLEQPSLSGASPCVSTLARRIHGWSWQAVRLARPGASGCNRDLVVYSFR